MYIFNCNILLLSFYFEISVAFHKYNLLTLNFEAAEKLDNRILVQKDPSTFEQLLRTPLDHFNKTDVRSWRMKFFGNYKHFRNNGPIILQAGLEGNNRGGFQDFSQQLARETGGALFTNQHRYYGLSSFEFPSLDYLSSRQSLADMATLLRHLKAQKSFENSKAVVIGGSYGGSLAAWMRLLYPDLVDAAHASSAPLVAKADFPEYMKHVSDVYRTHCDPEDYRGIKDRFASYDALVKTKVGLKRFAREVAVCPTNNLHELVNVHAVFLQLTNPFASAAQIGTPQNIKQHCRVMNKPESSFCKFSFYDMTKAIRALPTSAKYWIYQTCNEFGFFQTLSSKDQIFTQNLPVEYYYAICSAVFGPEFDMGRVNRGIEETNKLYGGLNRNLTRVVFVNGDLDPWSHVSALQDLSPEAPARIIPGANHCQDLAHPNGNLEVMEVQEFSKRMIKTWIGLLL